ncbi:translation initiation factor IF-2-like [Lutra lutra]|uniref:translation initiation factor IF-2-like n=1 Tax=Lutra lutra TaxID=9657 RepID=UPI001FD490BA|nr:translation initiation factor IF-2-like [Lutra lutra]
MTVHQTRQSTRGLVFLPVVTSYDLSTALFLQRKTGPSLTAAAVLATTPTSPIQKADTCQSRRLRNLFSTFPSLPSRSSSTHSGPAGSLPLLGRTHPPDERWSKPLSPLRKRSPCRGGGSRAARRAALRPVGSPRPRAPGRPRSYRLNLPPERAPRAGRERRGGTGAARPSLEPGGAGPAPGRPSGPGTRAPAPAPSCRPASRGAGAADTSARAMAPARQGSGCGCSARRPPPRPSARDGRDLPRCRSATSNSSARPPGRELPQSMRSAGLRPRPGARKENKEPGGPWRPPREVQVARSG